MSLSLEHSGGAVQEETKQKTKQKAEGHFVLRRKNAIEEKVLLDKSCM